MQNDEPTALQATYSDLKIIKTRGAFQLIFELPLENFNDAMAVLGGAPRPDREVWVAIARLNPSLARQDAPPQLTGHAVEALPPPPPHAATLESAKPKPKVKRSWFDLPAVQRASMRCDDHRFWGWLHAIGRTPEASEAATLDYVRRIAAGSRSNLGKNGFEKEIEAWDKVDHAYANHLDRQMFDSMR